MTVANVLLSMAAGAAGSIVTFLILAGGVVLAFRAAFRRLVR